MDKTQTKRLSWYDTLIFFSFYVSSDPLVVLHGKMPLSSGQCWNFLKTVNGLMSGYLPRVSTLGPLTKCTCWHLYALLFKAKATRLFGGGVEREQNRRKSTSKNAVSLERLCFVQPHIVSKITIMFHLGLAECARLHPLPSAAFTGCCPAVAHHRFSCALGLIPERPRHSNGLMIQAVAVQSLGVAQDTEGGGGEEAGTSYRSVVFYCEDKWGENLAHPNSADVSWWMWLNSLTFCRFRLRFCWSNEEWTFMREENFPLSVFDIVVIATFVFPQWFSAFYCFSGGLNIRLL